MVIEQGLRIWLQSAVCFTSTASEVSSLNWTVGTSVFFLRLDNPTVITALLSVPFHSSFIQL